MPIEKYRHIPREEKKPRIGFEGEIFAAILKKDVTAHGRQIPDKPKYLAIKAGDIYTELEFARELHIPPEEVTILEPKRTLPQTGTESWQENFAGQIIRPDEQGVFLIPDTPYDIVTSFNNAASLEKPGREEKLARAITKIISPHGIVMITPYFTIDKTDIWDTLGYKSIATTTKDNFERIFVPSSPQKTLIDHK